VRRVAGTGARGASGDGGPALQATFDGPKHVAIDLDDNVLVVDTENNVIRKVFVAENRVVRFAGTGTQGSGGVGGRPEQVQLARPHGAFVDPTSGAVYISDSTNGRILKVER